MNTIIMVTMLAGIVVGRAEFVDMDKCLDHAEIVRSQSVAEQIPTSLLDQPGEWMDVVCTYHFKEANEPK